MFSEPETLLNLAEVAIALAGFSAIVVVLKRTTSGMWSRVDSDQFMGMVAHAVFAVVFCFLPAFIDVFVQDPVTTYRLSGVFLGVQIIAHCGFVLRHKALVTGGKVSLWVGFLFGVLQFAPFTDWGVQRELAFYVVGIMWHILQAGMLFVSLVWISEDQISDE